MFNVLLGEASDTKLMRLGRQMEGASVSSSGGGKIGHGKSAPTIYSAHTGSQLKSYTYRSRKKWRHMRNRSKRALNHSFMHTLLFTMLHSLHYSHSPSL
jgi:hypothetical protein